QARAWFTARSAELDSLPSRNRIRVGHVTPADGIFRRAVIFKLSRTIEPYLRLKAIIGALLDEQLDGAKRFLLAHRQASSTHQLKHRQEHCDRHDQIIGLG